MTDDAFFRGHAYLSYLEPLAEERPAVHRAILEALPEAARAFVTGSIFADQWYPRAHLHALLDAVEKVVGGDERELRELGAMAARFQLGAIYRVLLTSPTPSIVFRRLGSIWRRQSTGGEIRLVHVGEDDATLELADASLPSQMPLLLAGWTETAVRMLGRTPYPTRVEAVGPGRWRLSVRWIEASAPEPRESSRGPQ